MPLTPKMAFGRRSIMNWKVFGEYGIAL